MTSTVPLKKEHALSVPLLNEEDMQMEQDNHPQTLPRTTTADTLLPESVELQASESKLSRKHKKHRPKTGGDLTTSLPFGVDIAQEAFKLNSGASIHQKLRSKTYNPYELGQGNYFQQATLRQCQELFHDEKPNLRRFSSAMPTRYALDTIRDYAYESELEQLRDEGGDYELEKERRSERQNFDSVYNEITHLDNLTLSLKGKKMSSRGLIKWVTCIVIGVMTGMCMVFVTFSVTQLQTLLWKWYQAALQQGFAAGFAVFFGFSLFMACVAGIAVLISPKAAGSGIPEVKAYLNGSSIPTLFYLKTLVSKLVGVIGSVTGSFMVGKEGPMVHSGAAIASQIGRAGIWAAPESFSSKFLFGTDRDKRDLISMGAAAGVSAAFGAPIGGMLFALEEVSSFWRPGLNWRAFFTAAVSNFTVLGVLACVQNGKCGTLQKTGLIEFTGHPVSTIGLFDMTNLGMFVIMGVCGGLIGAAFNHINIALTKWRNHHTNNKWYTRFLEVIVVNIITILVMMFVPFFYGLFPNTCKDSPCQSGNDVCEYVVSHGQFLCDEGQYNPMASLLQPPRESIIEGLFYYQDFDSKNEWYTPPSLWIAFVCYFSVAVITYGIGIPSGLFVPIILIGSTFGHVMGRYFNILLPDHTFDVGTYSLLGAAALLGGTTRMTISLTVILVEITDDVYYLLPIILTIMIAKWVGDRINIPLYDAHIVLKHIPFLEASLPKWFPTWVTAKDVMVSPVITLPRFCSMKRILHVLSNKNFCHNAFPIVMDNPRYAPMYVSDSDQDEEEQHDQLKQQEEPSDSDEENVAGDDAPVLSANGHENVDDAAGDMDATKKKKKKKAKKKKKRIQKKQQQQSSKFSHEQNEYAKYTSDETTHHVWIGIILRTHIMAMLQNRCYGAKHELHSVHRLTPLQLEKLAFFYSDQQLESLKDKNGKYWIDIDSVMYQNDEQEQNGDWLDFTPYMNLSPYTVRDNTPLLRVYNIFRSLGLRHLMVTNAENEVVGMITTKELGEHRLEKLIKTIITNNSRNEPDRIGFASERMAMLRGSDEYDAEFPELKDAGHDDELAEK